LRQPSLLEQVDRSPASYIILVIYITLAVLTNPMSPTSEKLLQYGAAQSILIQDGEPWRLLSYAFLHGGLIHLMFNSYCLVQFAPMLEARLGTLRFIILYVIGSLGGSLAAVLCTESYLVLVGGSGALFAMFGAVLAINMRQGRHHLEFLDYYGPRSIPMLIGINLLIGWMIPFVSNSGHIGGLLAGFTLTFCFFERGRNPADTLSRRIAAAWIALLISVTLYCVYPVLRWDYRLRIARQSEDVRLRQELLELVADDPRVHVSRGKIDIGLPLPKLVLKRMRQWGR